MTKRFSLFVAASGLPRAPPYSPHRPFINILTGGTSGVYYPIGVGLSQLYSNGIEGSRPRYRRPKPSVENLNPLQSGRGELALALGDSVADA